MSAPPDTTVSGRPVASLTLALNYAFAPPEVRDALKPGVEAPLGDPADPFYRNVWGYHALNLVVHLAAALALFGIIRRTLLTAPLRARFGTASTALAFAVTLLWLVHPLQTESVTYIVQRVESLMGLFYLLTLYCAIRALEADQQAPRRWWAAASIAACALGMGSKEAMVSAPISVALWIWTCRPEERPFGPAARPLLVGLAATWIVLAWLVINPARPQSVGFGLEGWTGWSYLRTQADVVVHYLALSIVPSPLVFWYGWWSAKSWIAVAPQAGLLASLAVLTGVALVERRPIGLAGAWFFLILAPTSSLLPIVTEVAAEHRMYLPVASVITLVVLGGYALGRYLLETWAGNRPRVWLVARVGAWIAVGATAGTLATMAQARNRDYWTYETLLADTVQKRPENVDARIGYGVELLGRQRYGEAESQLRIALTMLPRPGSGVGPTAGAHMYLGSALCAQNKLDEGIAHLEQALALNPKFSEANGFLAEAYVTQGRFAQAATAFDRALAGLPDVPPLIYRGAWFYATTPDPLVRNGAKAAALAERGVHLTDGRDWMMLDALAVAYAEQGRFPEAVEASRRAVAIARETGGAGAVSEVEQHLTLFQSERALRTR